MPQGESAVAPGSEDPAAALCIEEDPFEQGIDGDDVQPESGFAGFCTDVAASADQDALLAAFSDRRSRLARLDLPKVDATAFVKRIVAGEGTLVGKTAILADLPLTAYQPLGALAGQPIAFPAFGKSDPSKDATVASPDLTMVLGSVMRDPMTHRGIDALIGKTAVGGTAAQSLAAGRTQVLQPVDAPDFSGLSRLVGSYGIQAQDDSYLPLDRRQHVVSASKHPAHAVDPHPQHAKRRRSAPIPSRTTTDPAETGAMPGSRPGQARVMRSSSSVPQRKVARIVAAVVLIVAVAIAACAAYAALMGYPPFASR